MTLRRTLQKIKYGLFLLRERGLKYTYNYLWFHSLYRDDSILRRLFLKWLFPYTVPYPPFIEIETTTSCNLKCIMCERTYWKEKSRNMSFEEFKKILDQFPKLKWIGLTGIGESFMNPDFMKILRYVKSKGIYVELYDTFYFLDEKKAKELINLGVDMLILSIDGATKKTYEKIRVNSNFDRVVRNIKNFVKLKKKMNSHFPQLDVHFIVNQLNINETVKFVELAHRMGIDGNIRFSNLLSAYKEIKNLTVDVPDEIIKKTDERAKQLGLNIGWNKNIPADRAPMDDCTVWIMPFIFVTGEVICCCATNEANKRNLQKKYSFGNVFKTPFREIWNSPRYKRFREDVVRGRRVPIQCIGCTAYNCDTFLKKGVKIRED